MYSGKILLVDLATRSSSVTPLPEEYKRNYLGCGGLACRLLYDYSQPGTEPLSPANPLVFATGSLTGTMAPTASKYAVATKSPLTGFVGDSLSSGSWPLALKRAGYDAMVITGAASSPTYLFIDDGRVHFRSAAGLLGKGCYETEQAIRMEHADGSLRVASIGPAGENLVRYACIGNDYSRQAGRTGAGAVMGAKRLKAIAVRGSKGVVAADPDGLRKVCLGLYQKAQGPGTEKYRVLGTPSNVLALNRLACLPTRNFQQSTFEAAEQVSGEHLYEHHLHKIIACAGCPIACDHIFAVKDGAYAGTKAPLEYESLFALGPLCGIDDTAAILKAAELCDSLGLDTMSAGVTVAWAMECYEKGLLTADDTGGIELAFGNQRALIATLERIARREGLGDLLAEGTRRAASRLGKGSDHWAMHVKGLELPGYEPRSLKTLALGLAVGTRGACHNRSAAYDVDISGRADRFTADSTRGVLAMETEDFAATLDALGICKFIRRCFDDFYRDAASLYSLATGIPMTAEALRKVGERVCNLKKAFNIREGWRRQDDWLPPRIMEEPLPTGVAKGVRLTADELNLMIDSYYAARGWTRDGYIPPAKLEELGLDDLIPSQKEAAGVV